MYIVCNMINYKTDYIFHIHPTSIYATNEVNRFKNFALLLHELVYLLLNFRTNKRFQLNK